MDGATPIVKRFFEGVERASNTFDRYLLAAQYNDPVMAADPDGHIRVASRDDLIAGTAQRHETFRSIGFNFVRFLSLSETQLDNGYRLVKARWQMQLERSPGKPIDIISNTTYVLSMHHDAPKVVLFLKDTIDTA